MTASVFPSEPAVHSPSINMRVGNSVVVWVAIASISVAVNRVKLLFLVRVHDTEQTYGSTTEGKVAVVET